LVGSGSTSVTVSGGSNLRIGRWSVDGS